MKKPIGNKAKRIALAGIGSAISLIFVVLSYYVDVLTVTFNVFATGGIMLTLSKGYYRESVLSVVVVSLLGFLICNLGAVPFIMVGGAFTVFTVIAEEKKLKFFISYPIKFFYAGLVFFILYKFTEFFVFDPAELPFLQRMVDGLSKELFYFVFNLAFDIIFLLYDFCLVYCYKWFKKQVFSKIKF